jgi:hypothetical protein
MGSAVDRIAALKQAHPTHRGEHALRARLSDREAIEVARELDPPAREDENGQRIEPAAKSDQMAGVQLRTLELRSDGTAKPTLQEAADALEAILDEPALPEDATHAEQESRMALRSIRHRELWEHLEGLVVDGVELVEER